MNLILFLPDHAAPAGRSLQRQAMTSVTTCTGDTPNGVVGQTALKPPTESPITMLHILLVDSLLSSQEAISKLLRDSGNTVTCCSTSREAFSKLQLAADAGTQQPYSLILKEHCPNRQADACRFLRRMKLRFLAVPVVVISSVDEREAVMSCLMLGAIDYMVKPLRQNELRHIWTRVWLWQKALQRSSDNPLETAALHALQILPRASLVESWDVSQETKCAGEGSPGSDRNVESDGVEGSKEGSVPDVQIPGHGSKGERGSNGNDLSNEEGGRGSNGSKDENDTSRLDASVRRHHHRPHGPYSRADNNSGTQVGNSATKHETHLSNGNGASTTLHNSGKHALAHTAEGRLHRHLHHAHGASPVGDQAGCTTASVDEIQLGAHTSAEASPSPDAGSGANTTVLPDRQSQPQVVLAAAVEHNRKRSAACLLSCELAGGKRFSKLGCDAEAATSPSILEGSLLTNDKALLQSQKECDRAAAVAVPQEQPRVSIPSAKTASDETRLNSLRLAELAHMSQVSGPPSAGAALTIKPLFTGAHKDCKDAAQPELGVNSAYQQHHSQPPIENPQQLHRRPVHVLYSGQLHSRHTQPIINPSALAPFHNAPLSTINLVTAAPTLLEMQQTFASQQMQHASSILLGQWGGQMAHRSVHHLTGTQPVFSNAVTPTSISGAVVPLPPSHASRAATLITQLYRQPGDPQSRDHDSFRGKGHAETAAAMAASAAAAAAFFGTGMAPLVPAGAVGDVGMQPKRADVQVAGPAGLSGLPLDPLTAMSAFLQQLSHEHILASTQRSHDSSGASLGGPSQTSSPDPSVVHPQMINSLMQTFMAQSRHAKDPSSSSKFQLLQQQLQQQLQTQQQQQHHHQKHLQQQLQQQHYLHQQQQQQTALFHLRRQQQQQQASFPSPVPPNETTAARSGPHINLDQHHVLAHHDMQTAQQQHHHHQVQQHHLHHVLYEQQLQAQLQRQLREQQVQHHAQQRACTKERVQSTDACEDQNQEVTSPLCPLTLATLDGNQGDITAAQTTSLLQQHLVRSMQAARAAAAAAAAGAAAPATAVATSVEVGLPMAAMMLLEPRQRRALALAKYRKKRKNLNFTKTIRYESRQQLAQKRVRVKGQFVKFVKTEGDHEDPEEVATTSGNASDMEDDSVTVTAAVSSDDPVCRGVDTASASNARGTAQLQGAFLPHQARRGAVADVTADAGGVNPSTPCSRVANSSVGCIHVAGHAPVRTMATGDLLLQVELLNHRSHGVGQAGAGGSGQALPSPGKLDGCLIATAATSVLALQQHRSKTLHHHHHHHPAVHRDSETRGEKNQAQADGRNGSESGSNSPDEAIIEINASRRAAR